MGYPITFAYYHFNDKGAIIRNKPKFPKGKAEKKEWKRRTHAKRFYRAIKVLRELQHKMAEIENTSN